MSRVAPYATQALTSPRTRAARRWIAEQRRLLRREPHRVLYFHQVDDPYSYLAAQALRPLLDRYDVVLEPCLAGPPPDDAAPERARLEALSREDAADVAPGYGLEFPARSEAPAPGEVALAAGMLQGAVAAGTFADAAPLVGRALWRGERDSIKTLSKDFAPADAGATEAAVAAGSALRARLGHYLGAMFYYGGEWYWGVDRLWHLERRLRALGAHRAGAVTDPIVSRPDLTSAPHVTLDLRHAGRPGVEPELPDRRVTLEFYPSLRSPYTAISMERVFALPRRYPIELVIRPVLPMVMRGLPVPRAKQIYIVLDTKREAEDACVPFGRIADPLGRPIERAFSLFAWARERGRAAELLQSFARSAFAEGIETGTDAGLRRIVERAGLSWTEALEHLDREGWREELEENRKTLFEMGLWGVPSFRIIGGAGKTDYHTWGQDRLWRVEQEISRRLEGSE
ncbi:MAG: DsbA family protein [Deltaproteobacteria bacterium]|nr:DsbA family protein [Deltaproteobacteria bacterium]